jgi:poly(3-hydroxybutyrate) depolymerase
MADSRPELVPIVHGGLDRPYLLQAPPGESSARAPLLVELHGRGIDAVRFDRLTGFGSLAEEAGFALALPNALGEIWNDGRIPSAAWPIVPDDIGYLTAVIDDALARLPIDPRRIYVVGMSNGATMASHLACALSDRIAAFAQVAGTAGVDAAADCHPERPVPILNIHGTADDYAPYEGGIRHSLRARAILRAAGPSVSVDGWAQFWGDRQSRTGRPRSKSAPTGHDDPGLARSDRVLRCGVLSGRGRRSHLARQPDAASRLLVWANNPHVRRRPHDLGVSLGARSDSAARRRPKRSQAFPRTTTLTVARDRSATLGTPSPRSCV